MADDNSSGSLFEFHPPGNGRLELCACLVDSRQNEPDPIRPGRIEICGVGFATKPGNLSLERFDPRWERLELPLLLEGKLLAVLRFGVWRLKSGVCSLEFGVWDLEFGSWERLCR